MKFDLAALPKFRDSWSFLYLEHARIEKNDDGVFSASERGYTSIPCAQLSLLMLGPGTSVTQAAIKALSESGCTVAWCGEDGVRFYASGNGESRSSRNLLHQAACWASKEKRLDVVYRMYGLRFEKSFCEDGQRPDLSVVRGMEGARVRKLYGEAAKKHGIEWTGRQYDPNGFSASDAANQALTIANSCLYGICHAAVVSMGLSPSIGFIHTGRILSFIYDVADLYKMGIGVPVAFEEAKLGKEGLDRRIRTALRKSFVEGSLLQKIEKDLRHVLFLDEHEPDDAKLSLWDPEEGIVEAGMNHESTNP